MIPRLIRRIFPQPLIAGGAVAVALSALGASWLLDPLSPTSMSLTRDTVVALALTIAMLFTYHFPIHLRLSTKVYMSGVVNFLLAALLPVPLAATAAAFGALAGEVSVRGRTHNYPSDIATSVSRTVVIVAAASTVANAPLMGTHGRAFLLLAAALVTWLGEYLTVPALYYPITGEPPHVIVRETFRESAIIEACQYLIGLLGVFAAMQEIWSLVLLILPTALVYVSFKQAKEMGDGTREMLESVADTVDLRDPYTGGHSRRVTEYATGILRALGKEGPEVDLTIWAARVHDIGKVGIPDGVLNKPGALTEEERTIMEGHAETGADFLSRYPQFVRGVAIVRHHHERWDGRGYPHRLRETQIPFGARVIAVADSYDAMTSDRPYRRGMTPDRAVTILREGRGTQWEGTLVDAFVRSVAHLLEEPAAPMLRLVTADEGSVTA